MQALCLRFRAFALTLRVGFAFAAAHRCCAYGLGTVTVLDSSVTAPVCVNNLPSTTAPVFAEIDIAARMFPLKIEFVPRVAELPTCQKILAALAPPARTI